MTRARERVVAARSAAAVEADPRQAPAGLWRRDRFLAPLAGDLDADGGRRIRLLSLDVFDTLLFRACGSPRAVFDLVGQRAVAQGLLRRGVSALDFGELRQAAQDRCYATMGREPRLEEIYEGLPAGLGPRDRLLRLEEDTESEVCYLNPSVASLVRECRDRGLPVVLLSDMYLGERRVRRLLARAGFDSLRQTERVIVSVDAGDYKRTGGLYDRLAQYYPDVPREAMVHVGDNVDADVRAARAAGLRAIHYDVIRHDPDGTHAVERLAGVDGLPELETLRRLACALDAPETAEDAAWHRLGASAVGPFVAALVDWALDQCEADGITLIAPLMREGHMLAPMLRRAASARGLAIDVRPLYVSRQAVALPGAAGDHDALVRRLIENRRHVTVAGILGQVGLTVPERLASVATLDLSRVAETALTPGVSVQRALIDFLSEDDPRAALAAAAGDAHGRLAAYLRDTIGSHPRVATLDIGFFGQIQRALDAVLASDAPAAAANRDAAPGTPASMTHLLGFGHGPVREDILAGRDVRSFAGSYATASAEVRTIHRSAPVIEQLLQGHEGSTAGYAAAEAAAGRGDSMRPVLDANRLPADELARKATLQRGMETFHELWLQLRANRPELVSRLIARPDDWRRLLHRLIDTPAHAEALRLGSLHDDVNFGSQAVLPFCPVAARDEVAWVGADQAWQRGTAAVRAVWPQGVIAHVDAGALLMRHTNASDKPYVAGTVALARDLRRRGVRRVIGYGTGEVASAFLDAARALGLEVAALVDSHPRLHGLTLSGVPIVSLDEAVRMGVHAYVVLSVAHAAAIGQTVRHRYESESVAPLVLDLTHSTGTR